MSGIVKNFLIIFSQKFKKTFKKKKPARSVFMYNFATEKKERHAVAEN
ncbi:MAG: hypothetical protein MJZ85_09475 [Bacteroidales bacterium]|nr:hypothetical protein [Bacteroidales bacterium]